MVYRVSISLYACHLAKVNFMGKFITARKTEGAVFLTQRFPAPLFGDFVNSAPFRAWFRRNEDIIGDYTEDEAVIRSLITRLGPRKTSAFSSRNRSGVEKVSFYGKRWKFSCGFIILEKLVVIFIFTVTLRIYQFMWWNFFCLVQDYL